MRPSMCFRETLAARDKALMPLLLLLQRLQLRIHRLEVLVKPTLLGLGAVVGHPLLEHIYCGILGHTVPALVTRQFGKRLTILIGPLLLGIGIAVDAG